MEAMLFRSFASERRIGDRIHAGLRDIGELVPFVEIPRWICGR